MKTVKADEKFTLIPIGKQGENKAVSVLFSVNGWRDEFGKNGTFNLIHRRFGDELPYPIEIELTDDGVLWNISDADNAVAGYGECELRYSVGDVVKKSVTWKTKTREALAPEGDTPPDPFENWYEDIIEASEEAQEAAGNAANSASAANTSAGNAKTSEDNAKESADNAGAAAQTAVEAKEAIEDMTVSTETLEAGSQATVEKSIVEGVVNLKFGIPKGRDAENVISSDTRTNLNGILRGNGTNIVVQAVDDTPTENSNNLVSSDGVAKALQGKQDTLTFDSEPTSGSTNPVTSYGVFNGIVKVLPTATASGSTASFDDGADNVPVKSLVVDVDPVQDLHGYDAPWPAGGGKNKMPSTADTITRNGVTVTTTLDGKVTASGTALNIQSFMISEFAMPAGSYIANGLTNGSLSTYYMRIRDANNVSNEVKFYSGDSSVFTLAEAINVQVQLFVLAGTSINITFYPMVRLSTDTDPTFTPYSNICPISGWTGADVTRAGVNVWDEEWELGNISDQTGENLPQSNVIRSKNYIPVKPNTTYYSTMQGGGIFFYDVNKKYIPLSIYPGFPKAFTTPANCYYIRFRETGVYGTTYKNDISINYPSTDTDYHSGADNETYPITFPSEAGTVYGGTLDVTNGVLTVDRAMVDLGTLRWGFSTTSDGAKVWYCNSLQNVVRKVGTHNDVPNFVCTIYPAFAWNSRLSVNNGISALASGQIDVIDSRYIEESQLNNFVASLSDVQLCYELATPIVYQLTPTEVTTLLGQNNIWANTGDVNVTYRQDIGIAINKLNNAILSLGGNI